MMALWIRAVLLRRPGRVLGAAVGIAGAAALLIALGTFLSSSTVTMMRRALENVPVDWQVQLMPGADADAIATAMQAATPILTHERVQYADVAGFEARTGDSTQTTGAAKVVGISPTYWASFPGQLRSLLGASSGVLLMQQTAANLHVTVGDTFVVHRIGLPDIELKVAGIVDLPNADAMFQGVGLPPGAAPQAPPDNVALIPLADWRQLFDAQAAQRPDTTRLQMHARIDRNRLPADPDAAYPAALSAGHNLEARIAGQALLANNIASRLDAVRGDGLYAKVLFLFLGAPGIALAVLLTMAVASTGRDQRQRDHALLRVRGASNAQILSLVAAEATVVGVIGLVAGFALAWLATAILLRSTLVAAANWPWLVGAVVGSLSLAMASVLIPSWFELRSASVHAQRATLGLERIPLWRRVYLDIALLAISAALFWQAAGTGYQVVLAPEGVPATSVQYQAFLAPLLLLLGVGLLTLRVAGHGLASGRGFLSALFRPFAGSLSRVVAAALARQRQRLVIGIGLTTLAFAFATSTAIFNETFHAQALVDAQLTNGADVSVSGPPFTDVAAKLTEVSTLPGVAAAGAMQHRLAYVGNDLQDLYGIDPSEIGKATTLSNAYFKNGDARATLELLKQTPEGVLVSEETVNDYQLTQGDEIKLRLQSALDHQYHSVSFRFVGVAREFPTAPRDSFLVANADYVAKATGSGAREIVLVRASQPPASVATAIRSLFQSVPGVKIGEIGEVGKIIGSSLTAINVAGLTQLELTFALIAIVAATGLLLALGLADRKRTFALLTVLRASRRQLGAFVWAEALVILVAGGVIGSLAGIGMAKMLVAMLSGVFDPPPDALVWPGAYLVALTVAAALSTLIASELAILGSRRHALEQLRGSQ